MAKIKKIALTGGPCAGKTVLIDYLKQEFGDQVQIVDEVASQLVRPVAEGGVGVPGQDVEWSRAWQDNLQKMIVQGQIKTEDMAQARAEVTGHDQVVVCDRGILDGAAYLEGGLAEFREKFGLEEGECLKRYDRVIHLNSLATDRPELYEELKLTNPSRFEDQSEAARLDSRIFEAYKNHPRHIRLHVSENCDDKLEACRFIVTEMIEELRKERELENLNNPAPSMSRIG